MVISSVWLLLFACSDRQVDRADAVVRDIPPPALSIETDITEGLLLTEQVSSCSAVTSITAHQFLCRDGTDVWFIDEALEDPLLLGTYTLAAAVRTDAGVMMALDGETLLFDGTDLHPMTVPVPVPIESMTRTASDTIWMSGAGRLFEVKDDAVTEVSLDTHTTIHAFAAAEETIHLAVPELVTVSITAEGLTVTSMWDTAVTSIALADNGDLWLVASGRLYLKRGEGDPVEVDMPETIHDVVGPAIWVQGTHSLYRFHDGGFTSFPLMGDGMVGVDEYGRLLQVREDQLRRHSEDRPVVIAGLPDSVMVAETLTLLPSDPGSLDALKVWVDDTPLALDEAPFQVTVDPELLSEGEHTLRFFTESSKGDSLTEHSLWIGALSDVQWPEIEALSEAHCARCHGGETLTDLSTAEGWEQHIETIIDVVTDQEMPLGGPYLSDDEIIMIRAWKHGGFQ